MTSHYLSSWLNQTSLGQYTQTHETRFFQQNLTGIYAPVIVQMTLPEWQITTNQNVIKMEHDVMMQPEALAWANESIHVLLMPHLLEYCTEPTLVLHEAWRVLQPEGKLILTSFNPYSLWGYTGVLDGQILPKRENCWSVLQLKHQLTEMGWTIGQKKFMVYLPWIPLAHLENWHFIEAVGKRWWTYAAAIYGLVLYKRQAGIHPLTEWQSEPIGTEALVLGAAKETYTP